MHQLGWVLIWLSGVIAVGYLIWLWSVRGEL